MRPASQAAPRATIPGLLADAEAVAAEARPPLRTLGTIPILGRAFPPNALATSEGQWSMGKLIYDKIHLPMQLNLT